MSEPSRPEYLGPWRTANDQGGYTKLHFVREGAAAHCFIVRAVDSGFMLCVPPLAIPEQVLTEASADRFSGIFGPWTAVPVKVVSSTGRELAKTVPCLLVDVASAGIDLISEELPSDVGDVIHFGTYRLQTVWPSAKGTLEALEIFLNGEELGAEGVDRLEGYFTAGSDFEAPPATSAAAASQEDLLHRLLSQSSEQAQVLAGMQSRLHVLDSVEKRLLTLESQKGPSPAAGPGPSDLPAWAPQLFQEGAREQLGQEQMDRLVSLAGRGPKLLQDLPGPSSSALTTGPAAAAAVGARPKARFSLSKAPASALEVDEEVEAARADVGADEGGKLLGQLLSQQTAILSQLAASAQKAKDPLHLLGSGSSSEEGAKFPGVRGMAARQLLHEQFQKNPLAVYHGVRDRLAQARRKTSASELEARDMFLHFQEVVPLGNYKTLTYLSFLLCDMWEAIDRNNSEELMALVSLGLVFCEQVANEQGHTRLAWLLTCREDPPFSQVEARRAPRSEVPHGALSDPRWVAAQLAYLRDVDQIQDRTFKSQLPPNNSQANGQAADDQGPKGKGRRRLSGRRRARWALRQHRRSWTRLLVAAGNFLVSGRPEHPTLAPPPLSSAQALMIHQLEKQVSVWIRLGSGPRRELDRAVQKFSSLEEQLNDLRHRSSALYAQFQPYSKSTKSTAFHADAYEPDEPECPSSSSTGPTQRASQHSGSKLGPSSASLRIDPDRLVFDSPPGFNASPYLVDPLLKSAYHDPYVLLRPASQWPKTKRARVMATREQQFKLFRKWDSVESLFLLPAASSEVRYRLVSKLEARKAPDINRADIALFARAGRMYVQAGLRTSPKKAIRNAYRATVLGGQIDGEAGTLSAPKLKTTVLCALTFQLAVLGVSTKEILSSIVGSWVFVAMFRRPFMCLITELYHEIARHRDGEVFALSHDARQELLLLTLFAPCMSTDLRARPLDRVFCTDASSYAADRLGINLEVQAGLTPVVRRRRDTLYADFVAWVESELECPYGKICCSGLLLATALIGYGKFLFYSGSPRYVFSETLNSVCDRFKHHKSTLAGAWSVLTRWQEEEPSSRGMVVPEVLFRAAISLSLLWGWPYFTAALLLGFHGLLRPGEFLGLRRRDLILPSDLLTTAPLAYVRILHSKTSRLIQRQHAKISDSLSVQFLSSLFENVHYDAPLFGCSPAVFRARWNAVFSHLHVPVLEADDGVTPKSLRGSGATWLYQRTEDIEKIQWRGRWQQKRTLEFYLQDVAGQLLMTGLTQSQRAQISELAQHADSLLRVVIQQQSSCTQQLQ
ncbi:hypothetical protein AK812_SmicGene42084 [Symbiodinium microadriaticum]|uniref:Tyr recombinase domain-containing protein n=1 Tax=Symbiodinium microadriaticum TaxID=2951 RepID=A0A1Q9C4H1_SYMMI|nr:hypothetical protein AK812_SmicGene42084 [Symbiodinium microadriaticum]